MAAPVTATGKRECTPPPAQSAAGSEAELEQHGTGQQQAARDCVIPQERQLRGCGVQHAIAGAGGRLSGAAADEEVLDRRRPKPGSASAAGWWPLF